MYYYQVVLVNGEKLDFDNLCNHVSYKDNNLCVFTNETSVGSICLGLIPYNQICYIKAIPDVVEEGNQN